MKLNLMRRCFCIALLLLAIIGTVYSFSQAQNLQKSTACKQENTVETASVKRPMKTIGIIGGVSWASSIEYYRIMNELDGEHQYLGGIHPAQLVTDEFVHDAGVHQCGDFR
jgi:aspartate racemase